MIFAKQSLWMFVLLKFAFNTGLYFFESQNFRAKGTVQLILDPLFYSWEN